MSKNDDVKIKEILIRTTEIVDMLSKINLKQNVSYLLEKEVINIEECSVLLGLPKNQIYHLTSGNKIPHFKLGKHLRFDKSKLMIWLDEHRKQPTNNLKERAEEYVNSKK